jgi:hypothetical protein
MPAVLKTEKIDAANFFNLVYGKMRSFQIWKCMQNWGYIIPDTFLKILKCPIDRGRVTQEHLPRSMRGSNNTVTNLESVRCAGLEGFPKRLPCLAVRAPTSREQEDRVTWQASSETNSPRDEPPTVPDA